MSSKYSLIITFLGISDKGVTEPLPKHLKEHERLPLQEVPESIYEKTSMGASSFSLFLHQNYLPFFTDIDSVAKAAHYLADSDVLSAYWMVSRRVGIIITFIDITVTIMLKYHLLVIPYKSVHP